MPAIIKTVMEIALAPQCHHIDRQVPNSAGDLLRDVAEEAAQLADFRPVLGLVVRIDLVDLGGDKRMGS